MPLYHASRRGMHLLTSQRIPTLVHFSAIYTLFAVCVCLFVCACVFVASLSLSLSNIMCVCVCCLCEAIHTYVILCKECVCHNVLSCRE